MKDHGREPSQLQWGPLGPRCEKAPPAQERACVEQTRRERPVRVRVRARAREIEGERERGRK